MDDRLPYQHDPSSDLEKLFFSIESKSWRRPRTLSLQNLSGILTIKVSDEILADKNVTSVEYLNQEDNPELPPDTLRVNTKAHIAIDDNYLYVWIPSMNRWKRSLLSGW